MIRVLVVEDHTLFRQALVRLLSDEGLQVVAEAASGEEALSLAEQYQPDVILMDLHMPKMDGVEAARRLSDQTNILMLTVSEDDNDLFRAIEAGASGYVLKNIEPQELIRAIKDVVQGHSVLAPEVTTIALKALRQRVPRGSGTGKIPDLSERERQVLTLIAQGKSNRAIAESLGISQHTVKTYVERLYEKLGVSSRAEAAVAASEVDLN